MQETRVQLPATFLPWEKSTKVSPAYLKYESDTNQKSHASFDFTWINKVCIRCPGEQGQYDDKWATGTKQMRQENLEFKTKVVPVMVAAFGAVTPKLEEWF